MILVTADQMKEIDHYAIKMLEIPSLCLMEQAGMAVLSEIDLEHRTSFAVVCGTGNNGADGLCIARNLLGMDKKVSVVIAGDQARATEEFKTQYRSVRNLGAEVYTVKTLGDLDVVRGVFESCNTIIDAIFGVGLVGQVRGEAEWIIEMMNRSRRYIISVDVPSGLDATTGEILGICVEPDLIVCLGLLKSGLRRRTFLNASLVVKPIGIPEKAVRAVLGEDYQKGLPYFE